MNQDSFGFIRFHKICMPFFVAFFLTSEILMYKRFLTNFLEEEKIFQDTFAIHLH